MAARQREWARRKRDELFHQLGPRCAWCGSTQDLTFDCIQPQGHEHHRRYDWSWRLSFYTRMHLQSNLQVLCVTCNSKKGG